MFFLAGCSTTPAAQATAGAHATATPTPNYGAEYLQLIAPTEQAAKDLSGALQDPNATVASIRLRLQTYVAAAVDLNQKLLTFQQQVPAAIQPDVAKLRAALAQLVADVNAVLATTTDADFDAQLERSAPDLRSFSGAANLLRSDLGLPPPPS